MDLLDAMTVFLRVADTGSFTRAAEQLGRPKARVSTTVQRLEAELGTRLLHRTTRRVQLTQDGQSYAERCRDVLADMDELQTMFRPTPGGLSGRLRVDMPLGTAQQLVIPRLAEWLREHPGLSVELGSTDRRVDPVREGYDCVLRVGALVDSSLVARPVGAYPMRNVASPAYLAERGRPETIDDLRTQGHRLVLYSPTLGGRPPGFEYVDPVDGQRREIDLPGAVTVNNAIAYEAACEAGLGLIQAPETGVRQALLEGRVVEVLPDHRPPAMPVHLLYPHRRQVPRRVQAFMDWVAGVIGERLGGTAG